MLNLNNLSGFNVFSINNEGGGSVDPIDNYTTINVNQEEMYINVEHSIIYLSSSVPGNTVILNDSIKPIHTIICGTDDNNYVIIDASNIESYSPANEFILKKGDYIYIVWNESSNKYIVINSKTGIV